jgi:hypothetical protein
VKYGYICLYIIINMSKLTTTLISFGLSSSEAAVYECGLKEGAQTVAELSRLLGTILAAFVSAALNLILLFIGKPLVGLTGPFTPLSAGPVIGWSVIGAVGAGIVYAVIRRYSHTPKQMFTMVAAVVLVVSFIPDILVKQSISGPFAGATWSAVLLLMIMHVVVALVVLSIFRKRVHPLT